MDKKVEAIAQVCHAANKAYCTTIGDNSQASWWDAPDWQKDSARKGVQYHLNNPDSLPEDSHNSWLKEKVDAGWVYGEVKDAEKKTHPCIVPFADLPGAQQKKDVLFIAIVRALE